MIEGARTEITRNESGEIIRLDVHYPFVGDNEVAFGIDINAFSKKYPLTGIYEVDQEYDEDTLGEYSGVMEHVCRETDTVSFDDSVDEDNLHELKPAIQITQHIGRMGTMSVAVAVTSFPMDEAEPHVRELAFMEMLTQLADGSSNN